MKFLSMFSGICGFEKGIEDAIKETSTKDKPRDNLHSSECKCSSKGNTNWECIGRCEIDKYAESIARYHYPNVRNYGDATRIIPDELPDFDCIVGGFPCQSFSIAGKRGGFEDTRGTLFFEIARIARVKRPGYLWLENVKGLLSHDEGNTFATIITTIDELGYDCQWQVLNSKNHGVPQNRERVFIIANLRGTRRPKVFPIGESSESYRQDNVEAVVNCLDANYGKGWLDHGQRTMIHTAYPGETREYGDCRTTISTPSGGGHLPMVMNTLTEATGNRAGSSKEYLNTIKTIYSTTNQIRRLTPIECERLQGFPDNWTKYGIDEKGNQVEISDTQRYKCLGNAVTTNVIRDIDLEWMIL